MANPQARRRQEKALDRWMKATYADMQNAVVRTEKTREEWEKYRIAQINQLRAKLGMEPLS